eukprot:Skav234682  [mRNA]  locus=scaffold3643:25948:27384:- [translate_table: standard]
MQFGLSPPVVRHRQADWKHTASLGPNLYRYAPHCYDRHVLFLSGNLVVFTEETALCEVRWLDDDGDWAWHLRCVLHFPS